MLFYHANDDDLVGDESHIPEQDPASQLSIQFLNTHFQSEGQTIGSNTTPTKASEIFNVLVTPSTEPGHSDGGGDVEDIPWQMVCQYRDSSKGSF